MKHITALIVDDDEVNCRLLQQMLKPAGIEAVTVSNAEDAAILYSIVHCDIDIVILDVVMPGMNGATCLQAMLRTNPELRCLAMTGHIAHASLDQMIELGLCGILRKPFETGQLIRKIQDITSARERKILSKIESGSSHTAIYRRSKSEH